MAKYKYTQGQSTDTLMRTPISKFSEMPLSAQREYVSRLGATANKRLKALQKSDIYNSAVIRLEESGGKITTKTNDLTEEFIRAREFLKNRFSQKSEWNKVIRNIKNKSNSEYIGDLSITDVSKVFSYYDVLREENPELVNKVYKYDLMDQISILIMDGLDKEAVLRNSINWLKDQYSARESEFKSTSRSFSAGLEYDIPKRKKRKTRSKRK